MSAGTVLWIVGQFKETTAKNQAVWEFQGVFDTEQGAINACRNSDYFIGPARLNEAVPHDAEEWPGVRYPTDEDEQS